MFPLSVYLVANHSEKWCSCTELLKWCPFKDSSCKLQTVIVFLVLENEIVVTIPEYLYAVYGSRAVDMSTGWTHRAVRQEVQKPSSEICRVLDALP
ncbi:hypothetical protein ANN_03165 [Periplaneta americana]|uniref:Uncharacterized protein n=1 Tax=Periplaneta americana TaxID=6978 RepID=A0ABQ8U374_PERAM|nr:hypothetical protein ANN_03165 [Periplaneta americana]